MHPVSKSYAILKFREILYLYQMKTTKWKFYSQDKHALD